MRNNAVIFLSLTLNLGAADLPLLEPRADKWLSGVNAAENGQPLLLFIFTRDCGNCHRSHAFLNSMQQKYGGKIRVVGIHSPEFAWEKDQAKLKAYAKSQGILYPVYLDSDMKIWVSLGNRYWPAFYLFNREGRHTATFVGETHPGDNNARQMEAAIKEVIR